MVEARVREELRHSCGPVHHELVRHDESDQVHRRAPLHAEDLVAAQRLRRLHLERAHVVSAGAPRIGGVKRGALVGPALLFSQKTLACAAPQVFSCLFWTETQKASMVQRPATLAGCRELETALASAVAASMKLPPAGRLDFIGRHLRAQADKTDLPFSIASGPLGSTASNAAAEIKELEVSLSKAVNASVEKTGWPLTAVADTLADVAKAQAAPPEAAPEVPSVLPPQVQSVFDSLFDQNKECVARRAIYWRCRACSCAPA